MRAAVSAFKENNPTSDDDTKVIIVDKDFGSIAVLEELFTLARILLCQVHATRHVNKVLCT